jgi:hypothetical protein
LERLTRTKKRRREYGAAFAHSPRRESVKKPSMPDPGGGLSNAGEPSHRQNSYELALIVSRQRRFDSRFTAHSKSHGKTGAMLRRANSNP